TPGELKLIGARVRGKKHKHEGTHCDDWFELAVSGDWKILAVSDGAGSKKFSRVGAKVGCEAAVKELKQKLEKHQIELRKSWSKETFERDRTTLAFMEEDIEFVQKALHTAMQEAYKAIEQAVAERSESDKYAAILGRQLDVKDLSATLLLAVHTIIKHQGNNYSFILTCQVGDGMIAAIDYQNKLRLLAMPDSGEFAGQTDFLTSTKKLTPGNLTRKTFPCFCPLKALMVMSDGVADDYFPNDPGLLNLYGDLLLNRVIDFAKPNVEEEERTNALQKTALGNLEAVQTARPLFQSVVPRLTDPKDEPKQVRLYSITNYAKELGQSVSEVIASPALLEVGLAGEPMWDTCEAQPPEERLRIWLDSYQVRGSFDDRTLVVLYSEAAR
ncbi:MAG: protein phosphatase 2C domain-containing protein, partial [Symploca sp. SIO1A3]|nr:protein phosphatase 2C domain-containing protein [Symploca sp. SIO1A3]